MDTQISQAVQELLEAPQKVAPEPEKDEAPGRFQFKAEKDPTGLPIEHADYIKASCKACYGRGYITSLLGDGYRKDPAGARVARLARRQSACGCVHKGYRKIRDRLDSRVIEDLDFWRAGRKDALEKSLLETEADADKAAILKLEADAEKDMRSKAEREALVAMGYADAETIAAVRAGA